jgi:hypothetical protein
MLALSPWMAAFLIVTMSTRAATAQSLETLDAVGPYLNHCIERRTANQSFSGGHHVTFRFSFRRDGTILGQPTATFSRPRRGEPEQERFIAILTGAIRSCAPLPFSTGLGAAIAGRPYLFRYMTKSAKDQIL